MNHDWARKILGDYIEAADRLWVAREMERWGDAQEAIVELQRGTPLVREILRRLDPRLATIDPDEGAGAYEARKCALEGLGLLDVLDERGNLGPAGPSLNAELLHPWVWDAARTFWESKHYAQAVEQAWKSINAHLQYKAARRDVSDDVLVNEVLSPTRATGDKTKLRAPGEESDVGWASRQRGMHALGQACVAGMRNVVAHEHVELPEQIALEYLATLSVLARWIDGAVATSE